MQPTTVRKMHYGVEDAREQYNHAGSRSEKEPLRSLDAAVTWANTLTVFGVNYKPYWIMSDIAVVLALVYAWLFSKRFVTVSGAALAIALLCTLLIYKVVLEVKRYLNKTAARSFLQDCLLVIVPSFLIVSVLLRQPLALTFAFLGTLLPLYGCIARIGCFLGGCCYGRPSPNGVLYPAAIFQPAGRSCRIYSPSSNPGVRVFPIQLLEAAGHGTLFIALATLVWNVPTTASSILVLYLSLYAVVRFVLDFYRTASARPRYGRFSEAQLVCVAVEAASLAILVHAHL